MLRLRLRRLAVLGLLGALGAGFLFAARDRSHEVSGGGDVIGLYSSLPILWPESPDLAGLLDTATAPHWALAVLQERGRVVPLDALDALADEGARGETKGMRLLVVAQPRPLSPQENVALDHWVRRGGRVLLFADPMLTHDSAFAIGDRRRPQDIAMISPLLAHWGLSLEFVEMQPAGTRLAEVFGVGLPVALPGRFAASGRGGDCVPRDHGLAAMCRIGAGRVIAIADAAVLEADDPAGVPARREALVRLISTIESVD